MKKVTFMLAIMLGMGMAAFANDPANSYEMSRIETNCGGNPARIIWAGTRVVTKDCNGNVISDQTFLNGKTCENTALVYDDGAIPSDNRLPFEGGDPTLDIEP